MKRMLKKSDLLNGSLFLISPFMAIPTIFFGIVNKSKFSLGLLVLLFGLVSYMYIPHVSNDRARYFELYEDFSDKSFVALFAYLILTGQDFILQSMFYFASQINLPAQLVFAFSTIVTIGFIMYTYGKITFNSDSTTPQLRFIAIMFLCLAIPFVDLLSGTRFMFAASFVLMAFYKGLVERKKIAFLFLLLAVCIHFSVYIFVFIFLVLYLFPNTDKLYKILFVTSFFFVLIPIDFLMLVFNSLGISGGLEMKSEAYLGGDDFVKKGVEESYLQKIAYFLSLIWIFGIYLYTYFKIKNKSIFKNIVLFTATIINVFFSVPTIFFRYSIVLGFFFVILLIIELYENKQKSGIYFFGIILSLILFIQILFSLQNITKTFSNKNSWLLVLIVNSELINSNDFIE